MRHAIVLMLSAIPLWLGGFVVKAATSDFLVEAPPAAGLWPVPLIGGFALWFAAEKNFLPKLCGRLGVAGWIAVVAAALAHAGTGLWAHSHAVAEPQMRGQIERIDVSSSRHSRTITTTIALQDGTSLVTNDYPGEEYGSMGRCLSVRRMDGPFGFVWLRVAEAAPLPPAPGPGQLAWPVEPVSRAECFSDRPLSELRGTV